MLIDDASHYLFWYASNLKQKI